MVRIWPEFFAAFLPPTTDERLADARAEIDDLRYECKILRLEREVMRHDRDFYAARLAEVEAGVATLQKALDGAEARVALDVKLIRALTKQMSMQDIRLVVGAGKLPAANVLAAVNAELRRRANHVIGFCMEEAS